MKRRNILAAIILCALLMAVVASAAVTVYITETGNKYHTSGCRYLSKSKIAISLDEAKAQGYAPCGACKFLQGQLALFRGFFDIKWRIFRFLNSHQGGTRNMKIDTKYVGTKSVVSLEISSSEQIELEIDILSQTLIQVQQKNGTNAAMQNHAEMLRKKVMETLRFIGDPGLFSFREKDDVKLQLLQGANRPDPTINYCFFTDSGELESFQSV